MKLLADSTMEMTNTTVMLNRPIKLSRLKRIRFRAVLLTRVAGGSLCSFRCFVRTAQPCLGKDCRSMLWSIRSSIDGGGFDPSPSNGISGRTRLIRTIQAVTTKIVARLQKLREDLPMKLLFFLAGFYCATAFSTVIGQTGDWDILSAAFGVLIVEGIGALMYKASLPLLDKIRSLITMFNYWKAGLCFGLFLDSFKY